MHPFFSDDEYLNNGAFFAFPLPPLHHFNALVAAFFFFFGRSFVFLDGYR